MASLAVVPIDRFIEAYNIVKMNQPSDIDVKPILKYFENTWINGDYSIQDWNQFGVYNDRTNNNVEIYNKQINKKLQTKPNLLKFIDFLIKQENKMGISLLQGDKNPFYAPKQTKIVFKF